MKRNVELLEQTMQVIKDTPELHRQGYWGTKTDCGTAMCFAGWAVTLEGWVFQFGDYESTDPNERSLSSFVVKGDDQIGRHVPEVARALLGLENHEAETLFDAINTPEMLERMVKDLVNDEPLKDFTHYRYECE